MWRYSTCPTPREKLETHHTYEDHTFDQSRTNAVYPMTPLFMEVPKTSVDEGVETVKITRTGQAAVLINIAISEPETTFRAMNKLLYMITISSLDKIFRNSVSGKLKSTSSPGPFEEGGEGQQRPW